MLIDTNSSLMCSAYLDGHFENMSPANSLM